MKMNKTVKTIIIIAIVLIIIGACIGGFFIWRHNSMYISEKAAIAAAIADAGLETSDILKTDAEFEKNAYSAWYDVEIHTRGMEYEYDIDAVTGEVLSATSEIDD
jgi:uncharacterized membrane protein YkoI